MGSATEVVKDVLSLNSPREFRLSFDLRAEGGLEITQIPSGPCLSTKM